MSTAALLFVGATCSVLVARRALSETREGQQQTFPVDEARDLKGRVVPLLGRKEPTIVMINSRTCPWCKKSLTDIGRIAAGRPLPRLTVVTLEGAAAATPMLALEKITGATLLGPARTAAELQRALGHTGTPIFVAVDANGRVIRAMPGYPIYEEMKRWVAVMAGDENSP
ncbi:MAG: hypothetical protein IBJ03_03905 [Gemmatimonadaceae bacterium]|nr:hypothetical protein [Gemmatimonadaceae bacterium]